MGYRRYATFLTLTYASQQVKTLYVVSMQRFNSRGQTAEGDGENRRDEIGG
jgi:hypothetical protein